MTDKPPREGKRAEGGAEREDPASSTQASPADTKPAEAKPAEAKPAGPAGGRPPHGPTRVIPRAAAPREGGNEKGNDKGTLEDAHPAQAPRGGPIPRADRGPRPLPATKQDRGPRPVAQARPTGGPVPKANGPRPSGGGGRSSPVTSARGNGNGTRAAGPAQPVPRGGGAPGNAGGAGSQGGAGNAGGNAAGVILTVAKRGPVTTTIIERDDVAAPPPPASYVTSVVFGPLRSEGSEALLRDGWPQVLQGLVAILEECAYAPTEASVGEFLAKVVADAKESSGAPPSPPSPLPSSPAPAPAPASEENAVHVPHAPGVRHGLLVVLHEDRVVAFLQARQTFEDAEVDYVAVHPAHRNRGLGARLLHALEAASLDLGVGRMILEVGERNIPARQLYRSFGFELLSRRENYYHGREAALVLEKIL